MYCRTCSERRRSMTQGPISNESSSAEMLATAVRTVMYRNTLSGLKCGRSRKTKK